MEIWYRRESAQAATQGPTVAGWSFEWCQESSCPMEAMVGQTMAHPGNRAMARWPDTLQAHASDATSSKAVTDVIAAWFAPYVIILRTGRLYTAVLQRLIPIAVPCAIALRQAV